MTIPQPSEQVPNDRKLRELVIYISSLSEGDPPFGKVKLNKLLFYIDFNAYVRFGKSVTGHEYQKLAEGPAPRRLLPVVPSLATPPGQDPDIAVRENDYYGRKQYRPFALRLPDSTVFDSAEIELIHQVVEHFRGKSAREVSDTSHRFIGWGLAEIGETVPYQTALIGSRPPTDDERQHGHRLEGTAKAVLAGEEL